MRWREEDIQFKIKSLGGGDCIIGTAQKYKLFLSLFPLSFWGNQQIPEGCFSHKFKWINNENEIKKLGHITHFHEL